jgi:hypothetical protein
LNLQMLHLSGNVLGRRKEEVPLSLNINKEHIFFAPSVTRSCHNT